MASLDTAIANIALPAIAADLHVSPAEVVWVVNVYQIALVATLLPLGALGEIVGHERIYLGGLSAVHPGLARLRAGVVAAEPAGGANAAGPRRQRHHEREHGAGPLRLSEPHASAAASATTRWWSRPPSRWGRRIASGILALGPWPWLFAINLPVRPDRVPDRPEDPAVDAAREARVRFLGAALAAACLGLFIVGIGSAGASGRRRAGAGRYWSRRSLLGWILTRRQADHPAPMLPIDLFRRPLFALSAATAVCSFAVQGLSFVALPFYFEDVLVRSQVETGFFMTPWPLVVAIMAPIGGRLSDRYSAGILGGLGLVLLGLGMALLAMLPANPASPTSSGA